MKILLVAINARYTHTNLAIRYLGEVLRQQSRNWEVKLKEFSVNDYLENIAAEIYEEKPEIIGFSSYIWNITHIWALVRRLRPVLSETYFVAGGPEVSFDPEELLKQNPQLDGIVCGEAENSFPVLIKAWADGVLPWNVPNLVWRFPKPLEKKPLANIIPDGYRGKYSEAGSALIFTNAAAVKLPDLNKIPDPYTVKEDLKNRLAYVETSRGCPFNCQFCISSTFKGIRYLEPEKFRQTLRRLLDYGARTIKFVDRTFNANKKHAFQILDVFKQEAVDLLRRNETKNDSEPVHIPRAHCEMAGELLDEDWLCYLRNYPSGMIQLEIGVQSTHQPTLEAVHRPQNFSTWQDKVNYLQHVCNIPVHLDLIAGLPREGWEEISRSFDQVLAVRPNKLQLGFLKVLKGSGLWEKSSSYGLIYSPDPPYTVLKTKELSHDEILALTRVEDILEKYYNSGRFAYSIEIILQAYSSSFAFFYSFAEYWHKQGWFKQRWNPKALFSNLWEYLKKDVGASRQQITAWIEALRFDYYLLERPGAVPAFLQIQTPGWAESFAKKIKDQKEKIKNNSKLRQLIPEIENADRRQWARVTAVEYFILDIPQIVEKRKLKQRDLNTGKLIQDKIVDNQKKIDIDVNNPNEYGVWYLFYYNGAERQYFKINADLID